MSFILSNDSKGIAFRHGASLVQYAMAIKPLAGEDTGSRAPLTPSGYAPMVRAENRLGREAREAIGIGPMKVRNSLKSLRGRHRDNRIVRRKGRVFIINKTQRRFKARQG